MKKYLMIMALTVSLVGWSSAHDGEKGSHAMVHASLPAVTVTGQIIDPVCFLGHDASGPDHRACAQACAKMGISLAFFNDSDRQIYMIFPTGHANPNDKVVEFAEKRVEITGTIHKKDGYQGIEIQSIKEIGEGKNLANVDNTSK